MSKFELSTLIRPDLIGMKPYSSARDEFEGNASIYLDANENPFDNGVNRYPDPLQKTLKKRIAELKGISPERIFLGNGSDECIDLLYRLLCRPGQDKSASISPSYGMYAVSARINQVALVDILLNEDFSIDTERVLREAEGCRLLFICSPNNPTGQCFPKSELLKLVERFNGIVVIDEAYIDFADQPSLLEELDKYPNLAISQTFSKAFGMAGIRLGLLFGSEELIAWINKIKPPYNINQLTQEFALNKLKDITGEQREIGIIRSERARLLTILPELTEILTVYPSDANFILVRVKNANTLYDHLVSLGIVVRNRSTQPLCANTLRLTVGAPEENDKLIAAIKNYQSAEA
jgi:histidinol-phosphate aminotransferase